MDMNGVSPEFLIRLLLSLFWTTFKKRNGCCQTMVMTPTDSGMRRKSEGSSHTFGITNPKKSIRYRPGNRMGIMSGRSKLTTGFLYVVADI